MSTTDFMKFYPSVYNGLNEFPRGGRGMNLKSDSLSFLNLTEEEMIMLKIKAAMYSNGDIQQYIRGLLLSDNRPVPDYEAYCVSCREVKEMVSVNRDEEFYLADSENNIRRINVESVPKHKCSTCGNVTSNAKLSAAIEEALECNPSLKGSGESISFQALVS
jgi:hypothetical protein